MMDMNKFAQMLIRQVDGVVLDLGTGKTGIKTDEGLLTLVGEGDDAQVSLEPVFDLGMALPAFARLTPMKDVAPGSIVVDADGKPHGFVLRVNERTIRVLTLRGTVVDFRPRKVAVLGIEDGVMIVNNISATTSEGSSLASYLPHLLMADGDVSSMLPVILMATGGNMGKLDPIMLMALLGKRDRPFGRR